MVGRMARRLVSLPALALVVALLTGCGGSTEARPDLAFVSTRDGDYAVFEMNADGAGQHRLTEAGAADDVSSESVFFQVEPDWSPDGKSIAFVSQRTGSFDLYVMAADGTGTRPLTTTGDEEESSPTWSPEGDRIAFAREGDIYVLNADGSGARRISDVTAQEAEPAWSPDGRWIAYVRREPGTPVREIWIMRPDGTGRRQLTRLQSASYTPAWSPDGTRIAFATNNRISQYDIYWVTVATGRTTRVTVSDEDSFEPAWSTDGSSIAFSENGAIHLASVVAEGASRVEEITDPADNDSSPAWNPAPPSGEEDE
jgi:Tol biopolymer transport system component